MYKTIEELVTRVDERNSDGTVSELIGVSIDKCFIKSVANTNGTDLSKYKIIRKNDFAVSLMQVSRDGKIPVARLEKYEEAIMSPAYPIFRVKDKNIILPEYLEMWFKRSEFDREAAFIAVGGVRGSMPWEEFTKMQLPVHPIEKQGKIVNAYKIVTDRIALKQKINDNLEAQAINLYKAELKVCTTDEIITGTISDIGEFVRGKNITAAEMVEGNIPVISAGLQPSGHHHKSNVSGPSITVSGSGVNAGYVSFHLHDIWAADCSYNNSSCYIHCLYVMMKDIQAQITELQKGTAQPHVYSKELNPLEITYPNSDILNKLEQSLSKIFAVIEDNDNEIAKLKQMQTVLLATLSSR